MRRYDIVFGILLILSIIDFVLAAPVLVQEKRQACVDVVHILPRDLITVLGKRGPGEEDLDKLADLGRYLAKEYLKTGKEPVESSDVRAPSSSAPPGPEPGSTNVVLALAPNPAPSTANPIPLIESSSPSGSESSTFSSDSEDHGWLIQHDELKGWQSPQPNPNRKRPLTGSDPDFDLPYWLKPAQAPKLEESGQANVYQVEHVQQPNPK
jgi:hypothetical protein